MLLGVNLMCLMSEEWGVPLVIGSVDVLSAFDQVPFRLVDEALAARGAEESISCTIMEATVMTKDHIEYQGITGKAKGRGMGLGQGKTSSPSIFAWVLEDVLGDVHLELLARGSGWRTPHCTTCTPLLIYADNLISLGIAWSKWSATSRRRRHVCTGQVSTSSRKTA